MLLGAALLGESLGISPGEEDRYRQFGKQWFSNKYRALQRRICHEEKIQELLGTTGSDRFIDAAAIYELLDKSYDDVVTSGVLAVLIARVGLGTFCANAPVKS